MSIEHTTTYKSLSHSPTFRAPQEPHNCFSNNASMSSVDAFCLMISNSSIHQPPSSEDDQAWINRFACAVDQMPLPAFICDASGHVLKCNELATHHWGVQPNPETPSLWHGWAELFDANCAQLAKDDNPAARAIKRAAITSMDVVAKGQDNFLIRATVSSRPILDDAGKAVGAICAISIFGPADASQAEERAMFLSVLSHELRNPLSPIMSAAALLRVVTSDPKVFKMAEMVDRQSKQLARFLADLLDASRLHRAREVPCEMQDTDLGAVIDAALDPLGSTLLSRRQTLLTNAMDRTATLRCDPARVGQAIANILRNASYYSPDGAELALCVHADAGMLSVVVEDSGAGIDPNLIERAAEPFVQGAPAAGRAPSGAGLGLAIARSICVVHGGTMNIGAVTGGRGAHIELILPIVTSSR
jgi:signal transduction histidine kinase